MNISTIFRWKIMANSLYLKSVLIIVSIAFGSCAENGTTVSAAQADTAPTTTVTPPSFPDDPNVCSLECSLDGKGCPICSDTTFSCPLKQLPSICHKHAHEKVTVIDLKGNLLKNFQSFTGKYPNVVDLNLSNNKLTKVTKEDLLKFPAVKKLDLSHNEFIQFPEDLFEGLPDLEELVLKFTAQYFLPDNIFKNNKKLRFLDLQGNKLQKFPRDIFKPVWNRMTSLILNDNPIQTIEADDFKSLTKLQHLFLEELNIAEIGPHTFAGLSELREIDMDHNSNLIFIHENAFGMQSQKPGEMASSLEKATIRDCGFSSLDKHVFQLSSMKELGLSGNPWQCDCTIKWMVEKETRDKLPAKQNFKEELDRTECQDLLHRGIKISAIPEDHFVCDPRMRDSSRFTSGTGGATTVLVITFLLCLLSIVLAIFICQRRNRDRALKHKQPTHPTSVSQYRALYNQGNVQTHAEGFVGKEKDPFEI